MHKGHRFISEDKIYLMRKRANDVFMFTKSVKVWGFDQSSKMASSKYCVGCIRSIEGHWEALGPVSKL